MEGRGNAYHKLITKPSESRKSCSILSPYIAWGNFSVRQTYQFIKSYEAFVRNKFAYNGMLTRLKWRCHFIQKFEIECSSTEVMNHCSMKTIYLTWKFGKMASQVIRWSTLVCSVWSRQDGSILGCGQWWFLFCVTIWIWIGDLGCIILHNNF